MASLHHHGPAMLYLCLHVCCFFHLVAGTTKFYINEIKMCDGAEKNPNRVDVVFRNAGDEQFLYANFTFKMLYGGEQLSNLTVQWSRDGKKYVNLLKLKEKDPCKVANKYMGSLWSEIQANARMGRPRECPISPGFYQLRNFRMHYNGINLNTISRGFVRVNDRIVDYKNRNNVIMHYCVIMEAK